MNLRQHCLRWAAVLPLSVLGTVGACGSGQSVPIRELGVWSEFLPLDEVREHLPALAEYRAKLYLAIEPTQLDESLRDFLVEAADVGVEVGLWLQLPDSGVWLNELNAGQFAQFSGDLLEWGSANDIEIGTVIFDIEPSFDYTEDLADTATSGDLLAFVNLFADHHGPLRYEAARNTTRRMVDRLQSQGIAVMAVTLPWVLDDIRDLDSDLQDLFDMPVTGIEWDRVAFMLYRSSASDLLGQDVSPEFVAEYARSVHVYYGNRGHVAVGTISDPGRISLNGYVSPEQIRLDVAAARSAGIGAISVFSLDGMVLEGGPRRWLDAATDSSSHTTVLDTSTGLVRTLFGGLDQVLDYFRFVP